MSIEVPEKYQNIARDLVAVLKKHDLREFEGKFKVGYSAEDNGWNEISFYWCAGRHGSAENQIRLSAQAYAHSVVNVNTDGVG